jgi:hypothetical protein
MLKRFALLLLATVAFGNAAQGADPQPVYIVLYSRFYDHSHPSPNNERLQRLIPLLDKLRSKYPGSGVSALFEFSGSISQMFAEENATLHVVDKVKEEARRGLIDIGYTGEDEPSYLYRPRPDLLAAETPEARWSAQAEAAERFLNDFKEPVTGRPVAGLTGGLKHMQEIFGEAAYISGITEIIGGDGAVTHEAHRLNGSAMMMGIPSPDIRRGIEGNGFSAENLSKFMSRPSNASPEVFWEDGALRISDLSLPDNRPRNTDQPLVEFKREFGQLNRSHPRVIRVELGSYTRYLTKRKDGSVLNDPMEWLYYHPDSPAFPQTMKPFAIPSDIDAGYRNEEAVLNWLLTEFFPANPGSRFLSIHELVAMAGSELPPQVEWEQIKMLARDFDAQFTSVPTRVPDYLTAGDRYFTTAEAFAAMAEALAADKIGSTPVKLARVHGPITTPNDMGPIKGSVTVRDVIQAATRLVPLLRNTEWKLIPDNAVPAYVQIGSVRVNAAQFLRLMAWACLDPSPEKVLTLSPIAMHSGALFMYPKNTPMIDQGIGWTFKPAPLRIESTGAAAAGQ